MSFEQLISTASLGDGSKPKYQSIAEDLAQAIVNGQLPVGEKLPPQRSLAHRLGVTTGTISRAYAILERQGLAIARVGAGTYLRAPETADARAQPVAATGPMTRGPAMRVRRPPGQWPGPGAPKSQTDG